MSVAPGTDEVHVLLDVDGVVNAIRHGRAPTDDWDRHKKYTHIFGRYDGAPLIGISDRFPVRYSPAHASCGSTTI